MYQVIDLRLPEEATLIYEKMGDFWDSVGGSLTRILVVKRIEDEWRLRSSSFMLGEKITLRKSVLGVKIIRGVPDSGQVLYVDFNKGILDSLKIAKMDEVANNIWSSNLCQEVGLPTGRWSSSVEDILRFSSVATDPAFQTRAIQESSRTMIDYLRRTMNQDGYARRLFGDFDGDTITATTSGGRSPFLRAEPQSPPTEFTSDPFEAPALDSLRMAARQLTTNTRSRPPATLGPRPRNQRW